MSRPSGSTATVSNGSKTAIIWVLNSGDDRSFAQPQEHVPLQNETEIEDNDNEGKDDDVEYN